MATTVSIINLKGGVGKSTLTMILAEFLAFMQSKNVLLIDLDAQANLSYCMVPPAQIDKQLREERTAYHLLRDGFTDADLNVGRYIVQPPLKVSNVAHGMSSTHGTKLHMVVSTPTVAQLDEDLMKLWADGQPMPQHIRKSLDRALKPVATQYDYILIDCPPGLSLFSSAALMASNYYISPIIPEPLSLQGVELVRDRQAQLRERNGAQAQFRGVILNIVKHYRITHHKVAEAIYSSGQSQYAPFTYWLPDNERLRTLGEYDPDLEGDWAAGVEHKFTTLLQKYGLSYPLTNPDSGMLSRQDIEGKKYHLYRRISNLVSEFMQRCPA